VLSLGTGPFGGAGDSFKGFGMFDSADVYSGGLAEELLGKAIAGCRQDVLISTKATFR
jgi:aryl-alcohol dehydrogenase-like predicted oxidoreductase